MPPIEIIRGWQARAKGIAPPEGTFILPARGGLSGAAFFPEGFGLQNPTADASWPTMMAIGHNFGCEDYREDINAAGREDDKPTWHNLCLLLNDAEVQAGESNEVPMFVKTIAEAAFIADLSHYDLLRPVLLKLKKRYLQPAGSLFTD